MESDTFRPGLFVHLVGLGTPLFFAHLAYRVSIAEFVLGGLPLRITFVGVCIALALLVVWLYFQSGLLTYTVTEEGLLLRRLKQHKVVPWREIAEIRWNRPLRYFTIRSAEGLISFTSTDGFSRTGELLDLIHQKSECKLPEHLRLALYGDS